MSVKRCGAPPPEPVAAREPEPEPEPELIENIIPIGQRRTLLELTEATCRWPIGDPSENEFHFCGRKPKSGSPYCEAHARKAYQPQQQRRDRRAAG